MRGASVEKYLNRTALAIDRILLSEDHLTERQFKHFGMKPAFLLLAVFSILGTSLAVPEHRLKTQKHHKAAAQNEDFELETKDIMQSAEGALPADVQSDVEVPADQSSAPFQLDLPNSPNACGWERVGYLDMTDPTQQCPPSLNKLSSPRTSCIKKTASVCDSFAVSTSGASYQRVCGRFRGYQIGSTDAFSRCGSNILNPNTIEDPYVDGISITYGAPGKRQHIFTYAAALFETIAHNCNCPCGGGSAPPAFVGNDYYCESAAKDVGGQWVGFDFYFCDALWDGQQCGPIETNCCNYPNLAWFCKTLPAPITDDIEVRLCVDEPLNHENVALEFMELYII